MYLNCGQAGEDSVECSFCVHRLLQSAGGQTQEAKGKSPYEEQFPWLQPPSLSPSPIPVTAGLALAFHISQLIEASAWGSLLWIFPTKYRLIKATVQILAYSPIGQARVS